MLLAGAMMVSMLSGLQVSAETASGNPGSVTLIGNNSTWKYNDSNTDLGTTWNAESYDDNTWKSGKGPLGYPYGENNTTFGTLSATNGTLVSNAVKPNAFITYYFRNNFTVTDVSAISNLNITVGLDDGYVMYINSRSNSRTNRCANINTNINTNSDYSTDQKWFG